MKRIKKWLPAVLLLVGAAILCYPGISNYVNQRNGSYVIEELSRQLDSVDDREAENHRKLAQQYNFQLTQGVTGDNYDSILDFGQGVMGAVQIPEIHVYLPIYHGVSEEVLAKGVGHMPDSAFPIGGEGNHSVLTGHTGLPSAKLFTDLSKLQLGDMFYIRVLEETLAYEIDQIEVVLPDDAEKLASEPGKDYCTLLTCTPYGVNSHRLLVRGERSEIAESMEVITIEEVQEKQLPWNLIAIISAVVFLISTAALVWLLRQKKQK